MKVAFVSDTHFGYARFAQDASAQGAFAMLDAAKKADIVVLGGDIFDSRIPKLETLAEVALILQKMKAMLEKKAGGRIEAGNLIIGIHGTHERRGKDSINPLQMMCMLGLMEDVHNRTAIVKGEGETVAISGMGGMPDDLVASALKRLSCKPVDGATNFFVFHQTMKEFVPQAENIASLDDLPGGYDWYLCGHIHAQKKYMGGKVLIPGSTVITQLKDEEAGQKGYYIVDTREKKVEFVPVKTRRFIVSELEFEGAQPSYARNEVEKEIARLVEGEDMPIIKIRIKGTLSKGTGELDLGGLEREDAFVYFDNRIGAGDLASEVEQLREQRLQKAKPSEIGKAILLDNARKCGMGAKRADELFNKYLDEK